MNPKGRLTQLQTANPYPLELLHTIEGTLEQEKELHIKFKHLQHKGEWFKFDKEIKNYFNYNKNTEGTMEMYMVEEDNKKFTLLSLCSHIGELKMYDFIVRYTTEDAKNQFLHDSRSSEDIFNELSVAPSTQNRYISLLVKSTLILKVANKRGYYSVNPKFLKIN
jgi:hypothetical protein